MPKHYLPQLLTNYTPVLRPKPAPILASITDTPTVEIEISQALVPYLLGLLEIYRWADRFKGDPSDVQNAVGLFQDLRVALTEGNVQHILKFPVDNNDNVITAPNGVRGLWIKQAGGEFAFVVSQQGATGTGTGIAIENASNTAPILTLERPQTNGDYLQLRVNGAWNTAINRYGQINSLIYSGNLPTANQFTVGAIIFLLNSASPSTAPDGAYIGMQVGSSYFWTRFKGDTGATGGTGSNGADGLPAIMHIGSLFVKYPNEDPEINITPAPNNHYFLGFGLPRAATWSKQTDITRYPNEAPTVAVSSDTHGDKLIQFGIPRAATISMNSFLVGLPKDDPDFTLTSDSHGDKLVGVKMPRAQRIGFLPTITGAPGTNASEAHSLDSDGDLLVQLTIPAGADGTGSGGATLDDVPPNPGQTKTYTQFIDADGTYIPFKLNTGWKITFKTPKGRWQVTRDSTVDYLVTDAFGHPTIIVQGQDKKAGLMVFNAYGSASDVALHDAFVEYQAVNNGEDIFVTANSYADLLRRGQILVSYDVFAAVVLRYDFFRLACLADNPIRYWRQNEISGTVFTDIIANQQLTLHSSGGVTLNQAGPWIGDQTRAIRWQDNYAEGANIAALNGNQSFTLEIIAKIVGRAAVGVVLTNGTTGDNQTIMMGYAGGQFGFYDNATNILTGNHNPPNAYCHYVGTYDSGTGVRKVYVNGTEIASGTGFSRNGTTGLLPRIGNDAFGTSDYYCSEHPLYDYALTPTQVSAHYSAFLQSIAGS